MALKLHTQLITGGALSLLLAGILTIVSLSSNWYCIIDPSKKDGECHDGNYSPFGVLDMVNDVNKSKERYGHVHNAHDDPNKATFAKTGITYAMAIQCGLCLICVIVEDLVLALVSGWLLLKGAFNLMHKQGGACSLYLVGCCTVSTVLCEGLAIYLNSYGYSSKDPNFKADHGINLAVAALLFQFIGAGLVLTGFLMSRAEFEAAGGASIPQQHPPTQHFAPQPDQQGYQNYGAMGQGQYQGKYEQPQQGYQSAYQGDQQGYQSAYQGDQQGYQGGEQGNKGNKGYQVARPAYGNETPYQN